MIPLPDGLQERVIHHRIISGGELVRERVLRDLDRMNDVQPRGGMTIVEIIANAQDIPGGTVVARGVSHCNPKDTYSKRMGRAVARGKALAELDGRADARRERRRQLAIEAAKHELDRAKRQLEVHA